MHAIHIRQAVWLTALSCIVALLASTIAITNGWAQGDESTAEESTGDASTSEWTNRPTAAEELPLFFAHFPVAAPLYDSVEQDPTLHWQTPRPGVRGAAARAVLGVRQFVTQTRRLENQWALLQAIETFHTSETNRQLLAAAPSFIRLLVGLHLSSASADVRTKAGWLIGHLTEGSNAPDLRSRLLNDYLRFYDATRVEDGQWVSNAYFTRDEQTDHVLRFLASFGRILQSSLGAAESSPGSIIAAIIFERLAWAGELIKLAYHYPRWDVQQVALESLAIIQSPSLLRDAGVADAEAALAFTTINAQFAQYIAVQTAFRVPRDLMGSALASVRMGLWLGRLSHLPLDQHLREPKPYPYNATQVRQAVVETSQRVASLAALLAENSETGEFLEAEQRDEYARLLDEELALLRQVMRDRRASPHFWEVGSALQVLTDKDSLQTLFGDDLKDSDAATWLTDLFFAEQVPRAAALQAIAPAGHPSITSETLHTLRVVYPNLVTTYGSSVAGSLQVLEALTHSAGSGLPRGVPALSSQRTQ